MSGGVTFRSGLVCLGLIFSNHVIAASVLFDLTSAGGNGGGYGNSLSFSSSGIGLEVTSYGETGGTHSAPVFETAEIWSWASGLGSCNRQEGTRGSGCSNSEHEVDTVNDKDLVVFEFDQNVEFEKITVDPYRNSYSGNEANDRDIIYWVSQTLPDLTTVGFDDLDGIFGPGTVEFTASGFAPKTHNLSGTGQFLIVAGVDPYFVPNVYSPEDAYKIASIKVSPSPIPLPAAAWLFIGALATLGYNRRK